MELTFPGKLSFLHHSQCDQLRLIIAIFFSQEICYLQEELTRQKIDLSSKLRDKENEMNQWKVKQNYLKRK